MKPIDVNSLAYNRKFLVGLFIAVVIFRDWSCNEIALGRDRIVADFLGGLFFIKGIIAKGIVVLDV